MGNEVFIWDEINGMLNLREVLVNEYGLDLTGWTLTSALGVSGDGRTIVGYGTNPNGDDEAWIATVPEPASATLFSMGAALFATIRRRRLIGKTSRCFGG